MLKSPLFFILLVAALFSKSESFAQFTGEEEEMYVWFDEVVGLENTGLFNGIEYIEEHRTINEHYKFFKSFDFLPGSVVYDDQPYFNVDLKYNIYEDLLIVLLKKKNGEAIIQLHSDKINSFTIQDHQFIRVENDKGEDFLKGFYEVLTASPELKLMKKHKQRFNQLLNDDFVFYEFKDIEGDYILVSGEDYLVLDSRRSVIKAYPQLRKEIRDFFRSNDNLLEENPDLFYINLIHELDSAFEAEKTQ